MRKIKRYQNELNYLAGPYTHKLKKVMKLREKEHSQTAVRLKRMGFSIYAPIPETSALATLTDLKDTDWDYWRGHDLELLSRCDNLFVMTIPGWIQSKGVRGEIKFALLNKIPVYLIIDKNEKLTVVQTTKKNLLSILGVLHVKELLD